MRKSADCVHTMWVQAGAPPHTGSSVILLFSDACRVFSGIKSGGDTYVSKLTQLSYKSRWHAWMLLLKHHVLYRFSFHDRAVKQRFLLEHKIQQRWWTERGAESTCTVTGPKTKGRIFKNKLLFWRSLMFIAKNSIKPVSNTWYIFWNSLPTSYM